MRSEVACGMCSVCPASGCNSWSRPATKLEHTAGDAPNRYSSRNEWRRKLRISPKYVLGRDPRHRPVVVDARDRLHAPPVTVAQAHAVDALGAADVRRTVAADRDRLVGRQAAGHARHPQHLVAQLAQHAVAELVDLRQLVDAGPRARVHAGDEFELRLAEIGRDVRVRQCRAERGRVRRQRETAIGQRAQALLLHPPAHLAQPRLGQLAQALVQTAHAATPLEEMWLRHFA